MLKETTATVLVGAVNVMGAVTSASVFGISEHALYPFIGTTVSAFTMAILGALLAMGVAKPLTPRRHMWLIFVASFILGAAATAVLPHIPLIKHVILGAPSGPIALITSFMSRWIIPVVIEEAPKRVKAFISGNPVPKDAPGE